MRAHIAGIAVALPTHRLTNDELVRGRPDWTAEKIAEKTGILERRIAAPDELASDLAVRAAERLFASGVCAATDIDFVLLCTQSPDYLLPTTACLVQHRLGIPTTAGAIDMNLGCSGFVYGLSLARGLIESGQARSILLITADTYSKYIHPADLSVRTIFGDGAAATWIRADDNLAGGVDQFVFGTDGSGGPNLIVPTSGLREPRTATSAVVASDESGNARSQDDLYMNGSEIFAFTLREVPKAVAALCQRAKIEQADIDLFVFHQANQFMLQHLRRKMKIPEEKFFIHLEDVGNTVSSTIPIALERASSTGRLVEGMRVALVGFGVGYSWAACTLQWSGASRTPTPRA